MDTDVYAFIDGQNLYLGVQLDGWKLDFKKFFKYLQDKYKVSKAFYFIGADPKQADLHNFLKSCGFILIKKPVIKFGDGEIKGNCDADLVLKAMIEYENYSKALIVAGDGDYYSLVEHLERNNKFLKVLAPNHKVAKILRSTAKGKIDYIPELRKKLELKK